MTKPSIRTTIATLLTGGALIVGGGVCLGGNGGAGDGAPAGGHTHYGPDVQVLASHSWTRTP